MIDPPTIEEIREAATRLEGVAMHTPLVPLHTFDGPSDILLKLEIHQPVTSFKIRGVYNAVAALSDEQRAAGLSTVSAGNTAQALAWTARRFGVSARSIMPDTAPPTKIEAVRRYGGEPVLVPMSEVFRFLKEHLWENEPYAFIHPWTNRNVMIGHGTIGLEIIEDLPDVDTVFIPVGGGGLMGGVGTALKALKPSVRVIAVEPAACPALHESLKQGKPASVECNTICDGVAVPYMTEEVFPLLRDIVDHVELVSEDAVKATIKRLALGNRIIVEGAGALSVAAALATPANERGKTVCIVTGGSIDTEKLVAILGDQKND
ncbi:MAG: threonine/serine dehydratase [Planctomycetes bacterium]|nr:threonine/serine dehydratase [Planctomycetota bacterium]